MPIKNRDGGSMPGVDKLRKEIIDAIVKTIEPLDFVHALWQGGAAAFGRVDQWSDIDFMTIADREFIPKVFQAAEGTLNEMTGIEKIFEVPQPTSHGFYQKFYRLKGADPFLMIDFAVGDLEKQDKFLEPEIHGKPIVHIDRKGIISSQPLDKEKFFRNMTLTLERTKAKMDTFQLFFDKEYNRGNYMDAFDFYYNFAIGSLLMVLRMKYSPYHYHFKSKYINYELPKDVIKQLEELYFVRDPEDLKRKYQQIKDWFSSASKEAI
jgi:hypothetical protein